MSNNHRIWIWNHYATTEMLAQGGRHYSFSKELVKQGYHPLVFCASTLHNTKKNLLKKGLFQAEGIDGIDTVFVKTRDYAGNGMTRILNMFDFYFNVQKVANIYLKKWGKPQLIYASSVHPLTLIAGLRFAKKIGVPCICEVRDLWPETLVAYRALKEHSVLTSLLYKGEYWIYKRSDALIFTMEGGKQYLIDHKWNQGINLGGIDLRKVFHINNGVDIDAFDKALVKNTTDDPDLTNQTKFRCAYTGSIRAVNHVDILVDTAKWLQDHGHQNISILVYGEGDELKALRQRVVDENVHLIKFKGSVEKKYIPYILNKMHLLLDSVDADSFNRVARYGQSKNKSFEYLAAGKPVVNIYSGIKDYDYILKNHAGVSLEHGTPEEYGNAILKFSQMRQEIYNEYCVAARETAVNKYSFQSLTADLINVFNYATEVRQSGKNESC